MVNILSNFFLKDLRTQLWNHPAFSRFFDFLLKNPTFIRTFLREYTAVMSETIPDISAKSYEPKNLFVSPEYAKFYNEQKFQKLSPPLRSYFGRAFMHTKILESIIKFGCQFNFLENAEELRFCKKCGNLVVGGTVCNCKNRNFTNIRLLKFNDKFFDIWDRNPGYLLEGFCYHAIRPIISNIQAGVEIYNRGETKNPLTEADIVLHFPQEIVQTNSKNLVVLCGTNPRRRDEKRQAKFFKEQNVPVIFVTDRRKAGSIEALCHKVFVMDKEDQFLNNLTSWFAKLR